MVSGVFGKNEKGEEVKLPIVLYLYLKNSERVVAVLEFMQRPATALRVSKDTHVADKGALVLFWGWFSGTVQV